MTILGFLIIPDDEEKLFVEVQGDSYGNYQFSHIDVSSPLPSPPASPNIPTRNPLSPRIPPASSSLKVPLSPPLASRIPNSPPTRPFLSSTKGSQSPNFLNFTPTGDKKEEKREEKEEGEKVQEGEELKKSNDSNTSAGGSSLLPTGIIHVLSPFPVLSFYLNVLRLPFTFIYIRFLSHNYIVTKYDYIYNILKNLNFYIFLDLIL